MQPEPILRVKGLHLHHRSIRSGQVKQLAIGQHAINIHQYHFDSLGAFRDSIHGITSHNPAHKLYIRLMKAGTQVYETVDVERIDANNPLFGNQDLHARP